MCSAIHLHVNFAAVRQRDLPDRRHEEHEEQNLDSRPLAVPANRLQSKCYVTKSEPYECRRLQIVPIHIHRTLCLAISLLQA